MTVPNGRRLPAPAVSEAAALLRARLAASSVATLFGGRVFGLPRTHLAAIAHPARHTWSWNYWWQAHYLDAIIDAGRRSAGADQLAWLDRGEQLLTSIALRNLGRFPNAFYDDMAWLALAAQRLVGLQESATGRPGRLARRAIDRLGARLREGQTSDLGGGLWWNTTRDFKNAPATAPAALFFARSAESARAHDLIEWLYAELHDPETGLIRDGIRIEPDGERRMIPDIYTYNQGTTLGALLALGDDRSLARATDLLGAVEKHCTTTAYGSSVLIVHGGHDGGLFTGILARYLAQAAGDARLASHVRECAAQLVLRTADALWAARAQRRHGSSSVVTFPVVPGVPDAGLTTVELSTQVQAWTFFEAAYAVQAARAAGEGQTRPGPTSSGP